MCHRASGQINVFLVKTRHAPMGGVRIDSLDRCQSDWLACMTCSTERACNRADIPTFGSHLHSEIKPRLAGRAAAEQRKPQQEQMSVRPEKCTDRFPGWQSESRPASRSHRGRSMTDKPHNYRSHDHEEVCRDPRRHLPGDQLQLPNHDRGSDARRSCGPPRNRASRSRRPPDANGRKSPHGAMQVPAQ